MQLDFRIGMCIAKHIASHTSILGPPILKSRVLVASWRSVHSAPCSGVNGFWLLPFTPSFYFVSAVTPSMTN